MNDSIGRSRSQKNKSESKLSLLRCPCCLVISLTDAWTQYASWIFLPTYRPMSERKWPLATPARTQKSLTPEKDAAMEGDINPALFHLGTPHLANFRQRKKNEYYLLAMIIIKYISVLLNAIFQFLKCREGWRFCGWSCDETSKRSTSILFERARLLFTYRLTMYFVNLYYPKLQAVQLFYNMYTRLIFSHRPLLIASPLASTTGVPIA